MSRLSIAKWWAKLACPAVIIALPALWPAALSATMAATPETKPPSQKTLGVLSAPIEPSAEDRRDMDFASRGFIATRTNPQITDEHGNVAWDLNQAEWASTQGKTSVHPALLRNYQLLSRTGLFRVAEGVYQIRGFDVSNMTIIAGKTGYIIIDPLTTEQTARAAFDLVKEHIGDRPIRAVIYTHSHGDHFGGVKGIVNEEEVTAGQVQIIAPENFTQETFSEFVLSGNVISRRADYQWGFKLTPGAYGSVGAGVGLNSPKGKTTLILPTTEITKTGETHKIDGVSLLFQMVPESEAPAEMNVFIPERRTLLVAEIANCAMHNIQPLRGGPPRNALKWSKYLDEAARLYAPNADVVVGSHCWPRFGQAEVVSFLEKQRDLYKFIHDQTVRLMNNGYAPSEIAENLRLPPSLAKEWYNRGYYGTLSQNVKGVYNVYLGWYSGIPAHLNPLPLAEESRRYVALMGGDTSVLSAAKSAIAQGEYRWAATLLQHLVFADSPAAEARMWLADSYEQLAYQSESGQWRNNYLTAALELREPAQIKAPNMSTSGGDMIKMMPTDIFLDFLATRVVPERLGDQPFSIALTIPDRKEFARINVSNGVVNGRMVARAEHGDAAITANWAQLVALMMGALSPKDGMAQKTVHLSGNVKMAERLIAAMEAPDAAFPIVTGRPGSRDGNRVQ